VPAPNAYTVREALTARAAPAYSLHPRTPGGCFDAPRAQTPAPGAYGLLSDAPVRSVSPAYSMRYRHGDALGGGGGACAAAPGDYAAAPEQANALKGAPPAFTMRPRTVDTYTSRARSPGPAGYSFAPSVGATPFWPNPGGTGFSLPGRAAAARVVPSPGPQDYVTTTAPGRSPLSELPNAPGSLLGTGSPRIGPLSASTGTGPAVGPLNYSVPSAFQPANDRALFKRSGTGASIVPRRFHGSIEEGPLMQDTPAPDAYGRARRALSETPQPRFSKSPRAPLSPRSSTPAPGAYLPDAVALLATAPHYSLRSRSASPFKPCEVNGPAAFNLQGVSLRPAAPSWTMRIRWTPEKGAGNSVPGPGAYGSVALPHLALMMARTAWMRLPSAEGVLRTTPGLLEGSGRRAGSREASRTGSRAASPEPGAKVAAAAAAGAALKGGSPGRATFITGARGEDTN
jgi:hypothetical protein